MDNTTSELRQRHPHQNNDTESDEGIAPVNDSWRTQLTAARAGLAQRVKEQQEQDGYMIVEDQEEGVVDEDRSDASNSVAVDSTACSSSFTPQDDRAVNDGTWGTNRRGSVSSIHTDVSDTDDEVHELLTGHRQRPTPTASLPGVAEESQSPSAPAPAPEPEAPRPIVDDPEQDKCCRICFSDDTQDPDLGKLLSPCRCRGTSRYVHQGCLARWRAASANSGALRVPLALSRSL